MIYSGIFILSALALYIAVIIFATNMINKEFFKMKKNKLRLIKEMITKEKFELEHEQSNQKLKKRKWQSFIQMIVILIPHCLFDYLNGDFSFHFTLIPFGLMSLTLFGLFWIKGNATLSSVKSSPGMFPWI